MLEEIKKSNLINFKSRSIDDLRPIPFYFIPKIYMKLFREYAEKAIIEGC